MGKRLATLVLGIGGVGAPMLPSMVPVPVYTIWDRGYGLRVTGIIETLNKYEAGIIQALSPLSIPVTYPPIGGLPFMVDVTGMDLPYGT